MISLDHWKPFVLRPITSLSCLVHLSQIYYPILSISWVSWDIKTKVEFCPLSVNIIFCFQNGESGGGGRDSIRGGQQAIFRTTRNAPSYRDGNFRPGLSMPGPADLKLSISNRNFAQDKTSKDYYALKILTMAQVIKLKQVEHVINEKEILRWLNTHQSRRRLNWTF